MIVCYLFYAARVKHYKHAVIATSINLHQLIDGAEPPLEISSAICICCLYYYYLQLDRHWLDHQNDREKARESESDFACDIFNFE